MRATWKIVISAIALAIVATPTYAGLLVTFSDLPALSSGSSDTLDVYIQSDDPSAEVNLATFSAEFGITPLSGSGPLLEFASSQPDASSATNYVFFADSGGYLSSIAETFLVGDNTSDGIDVQVGEKRLLAQLSVTAVGAAAVDTKFSIDLIPGGGTSSDFLAGTSNTGFLDSLYQPIAFSSTSGTVTISSAAPTGAVPEPSTFGMLFVGMTGMLWVKRRRIVRR